MSDVTNPDTKPIDHRGSEISPKRETRPLGLGITDDQIVERVCGIAREGPLRKRVE